MIVRLSPLRSLKPPLIECLVWTASGSGYSTECRSRAALAITETVGNARAQP